MESGKRLEDMNYFELIAWLGIGSSHPGGFPATRRNLETMKVTADDYVLDAGCGSGLTACHLAKTIGCKIQGIDINPLMIEKARKRADKEGVSHLISFAVADVYKLPYKANQFDLVMAESITVFLDKVKVYREFYRVLKPLGRVADLEMALLRELTPQMEQELSICFGSGTKPLPFTEWTDSLSKAGFEDVEVNNPQPMKSNPNLIVGELKKDWIMLKELPQKIKSQPGLLGRLQRNANFMRRHQGYFGFGLFSGRKPLPSSSEKWFFSHWLNKVSSAFNRIYFPIK